MRINIKTIPHNKQRDNTLDDWRFIRGRLEIPVSDLGSLAYNALLVFHGLLEAVWCEQNWVSERSVRAFDLKSTLDDPGCDPKAPYHVGHMKALELECIAAKMLGVDWEDYERKQDKVCGGYKK
jgi:hypothetical protein